MQIARTTTCLVLLFLCATSVFAGSFSDRFIDPEDGMFDTSEWLLTHRGFLPVPIIITEPAVDNGLGIALAVFHEPKKPKADESSVSNKESKEGKSSDEKSSQSYSERMSLPPSISAVMGAYTGNDSWIAGGLHWGSWKNDSIRYLGGIGRMSFNLTFYGSEDASLKFDYNLDGWFIVQKAQWRISNTKYFFGGEATYFDSDNTFDTQGAIPPVDNWQTDIKNLGLGVLFEYDGRDNIFTPSDGLQVNFKSKIYIGEGALDKSFEYIQSDLGGIKWWKLKDNLTLGWRIDGNFTSGEVPFYALPFIYLRGIPIMRYQGAHVLETEVEARWNVTPRWGVVGFTGVGRTADELNDFGSSTSRHTIGTGFRYMMARKLGLHAGIDVAKGPEEWVFYITVGSAWGR